MIVKVTERSIYLIVKFRSSRVFNLATQTRKLETIYNELIAPTPDELRLRSVLKTLNHQDSQSHNPRGLSEAEAQIPR